MAGAHGGGGAATEDVGEVVPPQGLRWYWHRHRWGVVVFHRLTRTSDGSRCFPLLQQSFDLLPR